MTTARVLGFALLMGLALAGCSGDGEGCQSDQDCPAGQVCSPFGVCQAANQCEAGQVLCGESCVDLASDPGHCGTCDNACQPGESCLDGVCTGGGSCEDQGLTTCQGQCVDLQTDGQHCGACNNACAADETCVSGDCLAQGSCEQQGLVDCGGECVDVNSDPSHCGECNHYCLGFSCCAGQCANLNNDILNCGSCGNPCPAGQLYCDGGTCTTPPCEAGTTCNQGETCCATQCCGSDQLCCTVPGPVGSDTLCSDPVEGTCPTGCVECVCMAPDTPVATPSGYRPISSLGVGDLVYSVHHFSVRAVPVRAIRRTPAIHHRVIRVHFENGAVLEGSRGHPTADGRTFSGLAAGDRVGQVGIRSVATVDYRHSHTYDILPDSDSGAYFAAGVLIGSTLAR